jgi:hypothetical protein
MLLENVCKNEKLRALIGEILDEKMVDRSMEILKSMKEYKEKNVGIYYKTRKDEVEKIYMIMKIILYIVYNERVEKEYGIYCELDEKIRGKIDEYIQNNDVIELSKSIELKKICKKLYVGADKFRGAQFEIKEYISEEKVFEPKYIYKSTIIGYEEKELENILEIIDGMVKEVLKIILQYGGNVELLKEEYSEFKYTKFPKSDKKEDLKITRIMIKNRTEYVSGPFSYKKIRFVNDNSEGRSNEISIFCKTNNMEREYNLIVSENNFDILKGNIDYLIKKLSELKEKEEMVGGVLYLEREPRSEKLEEILKINCGIFKNKTISEYKKLLEHRVAKIVIDKVKKMYEKKDGKKVLIYQKYETGIDIKINLSMIDYEKVKEVRGDLEIINEILKNEHNHLGENM